MSARDELAWIIGERYHAPHQMATTLDAAIADAILAAGYTKPRTITTAEELDALRFQSVVLDAYGTPYVCERHATDGSRNEWNPAGMSHLEESEGILYHGPVLVVHEGDPTS